MEAAANINKWKIDVKYQENGALRATASGVLLVPPQDALTFVTDAAGDRLFRVAERKALSDGPQGSRRVEVVNKAAIRVLAWKLWSTSRVTYEIDARGQQAEALAHKQQQLWMPMKTSTPAWEPAEERVTFQLVESSMLQSLTGTWKLQPIRLHHSALPEEFSKDTAAPKTAAVPAAVSSSGWTGKVTTLQGSSTPSKAALGNILGNILSPRSSHNGIPITKSSSSTNNTASCDDSSSAGGSKAGFVHKLALLSPRRKAATGSTGPTNKQVAAITAATGSSTGGGSGDGTGSAPGLFGAGSLIGALWGDGSSSSSGGKDSSNMAGGRLLPPGLSADAEGFVTATLVQYEQVAQPKGMPPGIRYVPGLSDAVAASVGKEVRQLLDKVSCVSDVAVCQGLRPQEALGFLIEQMDMAGGSFKALQKQLRKQHRQLQRAAVSAAAKTNNNTDNKDLLLYADATAIASTLSPVLNPLDASLPIKAAAAGRIMSHPVADLAEYDD